MRGAAGDSYTDGACPVDNLRPIPETKTYRVEGCLPVTSGSCAFTIQAESPEAALEQIKAAMTEVLP